MTGLPLRARRFLALIPACALLLLLPAAGCGGDAPLSPTLDPGGLPAALPGPGTGESPEATRFYEPSQQRTVMPLVNLPTRTPAGMARPAGLPGAAETAPRRIVVGSTPVPTPTLTPVPPRVFDPEHTPGPAAYAVPGDVAGRAWVLEPVSCFEDFFNRITWYDGPEAFGPEVLQSISDDMLASREDCRLEGWSPVFAVGPVAPCDKFSSIGGSLSHNGYHPHPAFMVRKGRYSVLGPTVSRFAELDLFLIHLDKLPYSEGAGCWYGGDSSAFLYFSGLTPDGGYVHSVSSRRFPGCESALRGVIEDFREQGLVLDAGAVMEAKSLVLETAPEICNDHWMLTPSGAGTAGCLWEGDTGMLEDGGFLLNWNMTPGGSSVVTDARGGSPCWLLAAGGEWLYSDPADLPAIDYAVGLAVP